MYMCILRKTFDINFTYITILHDKRNNLQCTIRTETTFSLLQTYLRQIILSQLYFCASILKLGSMMPPRSRNTKCRVDSATTIFEWLFTWSQLSTRNRCLFSFSSYLSIECNSTMWYLILWEWSQANLSGCCNQRVYDHPPTACQQRSTFADREGYLRTILQKPIVHRHQWNPQIRAVFLQCLLTVLCYWSESQNESRKKKHDQQ